MLLLHIDPKVFQDDRLSLEAKGLYGMLQCGALGFQNAPTHLIKELQESGYLMEDCNDKA